MPSLVFAILSYILLNKNKFNNLNYLSQFKKNLQLKIKILLKNIFIIIIIRTNSFYNK